MKAWSRGKFALTDGQKAMLKAQAEHFASFVSA